MSFDTPNLVYIVLFVLIFFPSVFLFFSWFVFLTQRIFSYRNRYNSLVNNFTYNSAEFNINVFNLKIKLTVYTFLLLILFNEFLFAFSYALGLSLINFGYPGPEIAPFPLNVSLNCYPTNSAYIWEFELAYPVFTFLMISGDVSMCMACLLMIALLKFVFLAYQLKTDFRSIKIFLIKSCTVLLFMFIISVIPQTQIFSKIITPILCITIIYLLFKHRAGYFHILRQRCNDSFGDHDHKIHLRTKRNSIVTFNLFLFSYILFLLSLIIDKLIAFICMVFTEQSRILTAVYNSNMNLTFLTCDYQRILYYIQYVVATIQPGIIFIATLLYTISLYSVIIVLTGIYLYRQCRGVDPRYIRFEGNSRLN